MPDAGSAEAVGNDIKHAPHVYVITSVYASESLGHSCVSHGARFPSAARRRTGFFLMEAKGVSDAHFRGRRIQLLGRSTVWVSPNTRLETFTISLCVASILGIVERPDGCVNLIH